MDGKRGTPIAANADQSAEWGVGGDVPALVPKVSTRNGGNARGTQAGRVTPWFLVPPGITLDDRPVYLSLIGTGIRNRTALSDVTCTVGGVRVPVEYAGPAPGFVGMDQVNLRLTKGLPSSDWNPLILSVDGHPANTVYIPIK